MCSDKWARISKVRNKDSGVTLPTISIITPSFNQAEFLEECIESVLGQGYPHLEYVIMDGGSTDGSIEIIKKHEKHLAYWQSCPDGGQYRAVAEGFLHTTGEIMAWINSDDKYHPLAFAKAACVFADNPAIRWLTGRMSYWNADGDLDRVAENLPPFSRRKGLEGHFNKPYIQQESTFWRRSLWEESGSELSSSLKLAGDLELWVRFFRFASLHTVDTLLGGYRYHGLQRGITQADGYFYEACAIMEKERQACSTPDSALPPPPPVITLSRERLAAFTAACGISPEPPSARSCWRHYTENLIAITNRLMREKRPEQSGFFRNEMMLFGLAKPSAVSLTADRLDELAELQRQVQTLNGGRGGVCGPRGRRAGPGRFQEGHRPCPFLFQDRGQSRASPLATGGAEGGVGAAGGSAFRARPRQGSRSGGSGNSCCMQCTGAGAGSVQRIPVIQSAR